MLYYPLFFLRRFVYVLILVCLVEYKTTQVVLNISHSVVFTVYVCICLPHATKSAKLINIVGELTLLACFIMVSGFLDDSESDNESLSWTI